MLNQNLTPENVSPVKQRLKQDNSCFRYGFPSLFELNEIHTYHQSLDSSLQKEIREIREIKQGFSSLGISHILTNHKEIRKDKFIPKQYAAERLQENKQFYSLFQYDLLFNKMINKEKSVTQNCPCCPPLNLSKTSCEIQRQKDHIIVNRNDDASYVYSTNVRHIPEKSSSELETGNKTVQPGNYLRDMNNNSMLNNERLNVSDKVNHLNSENNFVKTKLDDVNEPSSVIKLMDRSVDEHVDEDINEPGNLTISDNSTSDNSTMNRLMMNDSKSKLQSSTLTVERVQSILEFYHSTSKDLTFENNNYSSDDERESLSDIDFLDISNAKLLKCAQCDKEFSDKNSREKHVRNDHKFVCKVCNKSLFHARQLQLHEERVHGNYIKKNQKRRGSRQTKRKRNPAYFCCGQTFKTGRDFGIHKSTHKFMRNRANINAKI